MKVSHRLLLLFSLSAALHAQAAVAPSPKYSAASALLEGMIRREMTQKRLPALSIALVERDSIVWARGFGFANPRDSTAATAETIYRVGSVSKLFTDIGIMQLVERHKLDLDVPVQRYLPDVRPRNRFKGPVTLRQLMSHRAGFVREPPVGNYFDPTSPPLARTVRSLSQTSLVYAPGAHTKYSNAAIATVGYVLERTQHQPFAGYLRRTVLEPLGLSRSAFEPDSSVAAHLARAFMWTTDGRTFEAPTFQLGMAPAGSMYSSVLELGKFMSVLFAGGRGPRGQVISRRTLEQMWTPQFAPPGARTGFGLGFALDEMERHRVVRHGGAIYGFATELAALPDDKLGVAIATTMDGANAVTGRIADVALRAMLATRSGEVMPAVSGTDSVPIALRTRAAGRYEKGDHSVELQSRDDRLIAEPSIGSPVEVRLLGDTLIVDDRLAYGPRILLLPQAIVMGGDTLHRVAQEKPPVARDEWRGLVGEYGRDHDILYILEKDAKLYALIEWFFYYPLTRRSANEYAFPASGLYDGERIVFTRDSAGNARQAVAANVTFPRRHVGPETGNQLRVTPLRPVADLRREALAAEPPRESGSFRDPDLVELTSLDSTIKLEVRYATTNNLFGTVFYNSAKAYMQRPAAEALVRAHKWLRSQGYGLLIHDAYRPWYVTKIFWEATPNDKKIFVADPAKGSRHNRGAAVDLTLYDLATGAPVEMVGTYDETSDRSYPDYPGGTALERWHRGLLRRAMEMQGFTVFEAEWWHFDYRDWRSYPIGNATFEQLQKR
ncbi:MAG: serine hydrolase [Gemmatimonadaceae bacterium]